MNWKGWTYFQIWEEEGEARFQQDFEDRLKGHCENYTVEIVGLRKSFASENDHDFPLENDESFLCEWPRSNNKRAHKSAEVVRSLKARINSRRNQTNSHGSLQKRWQLSEVPGERRRDYVNEICLITLRKCDFICTKAKCGRHTYSSCEVWSQTNFPISSKSLSRVFCPKCRRNPPSLRNPFGDYVHGGNTSTWR